MLADPSPGGQSPGGAKTWSVALSGAVGVGLAMAFIWLGLVVRSGQTSFDTAVVGAVHDLATGWVRNVLDVFTALGRPIVWDVAVVVIGLLLAWRGRRREGLQLVGWLLVAEVAAEAAKIVFDRVRPGGVIVSDIVTQASYPSGHVVRTVVTLGLLAVLGTLSPRARGLAIALAVLLSLLMGAARVAAGEHWPTDVVGGFLLSGVVLSATAVTQSLSAQRRNDGKTRPAPR